MARKGQQTRAPEEAPIESPLVSKARRLRSKGETRKALVALRHACLVDERAAWLWTLYGAVLAVDGRLEDARGAYRHALWLRRLAGDAPRLRSTQALLDRLDSTSAAA